MLSHPGPAPTYPPRARIDVRGLPSRLLGARPSVARNVPQGRSGGFAPDPTWRRPLEGGRRHRHDRPANLRTRHAARLLVRLDVRGAVR